MAKSGANPEAMDNMVRILTKFIDLQDNVVENLKLSMITWVKIGMIKNTWN